MLYARKVVTFAQKTKIDEFTSSDEKIRCILDEVIIPSLKLGLIDKYIGFIEVLKESGDQVIEFMARIIGKSNLKVTILITKCISCTDLTDWMDFNSSPCTLKLVMPHWNIL